MDYNRRMSCHTEFVKKMEEIQELYSLFMSFNTNEFHDNTRTIILDNLVLQMVRAKHEYMQKRLIE